MPILIKKKKQPVKPSPKQRYYQLADRVVAADAAIAKLQRQVSKLQAELATVLKRLALFSDWANAITPMVQQIKDLATQSDLVNLSSQLKASMDDKINKRIVEQLAETEKNIVKKCNEIIEKIRNRMQVVEAVNGIYEGQPPKPPIQEKPDPNKLEFF